MQNTGGRPLRHPAETGLETVRSAAVQQILPTWIEDVDPLDIYPDDPRPAPMGRPWVMVNMIASLDGATAVNGLSGDLGGPADRAVFRAVRASCDWIVVASGTATAESYGPPKQTEAVVESRLRTGRSAVPRLAIVTASGAVDPTIPAFAHAADPTVDDLGPDQRRPLVITGEQADPERLAALNAEIVRLPMTRPQPSAVLDELHRRDAQVVLCEGGPTWNGQLVQAGLVDEICVSISPILAGGTSSRTVAGAEQAVPIQMRLSRLLSEDGLLFARYTRV
ncbi:MAG: pyrimidine reductase family protein [Acidimicrobiaceae bacterium]|nr:pyrimidine reductase family protein [Acidimicrobiaceae bacterium]MYC41794.1 pyrimidine reductase family protein [Acidimicrobiaceae bacterium]